MRLPSCQKLQFMDGVFLEPTQGNDSLVLWLRNKKAGGLQHWERISNVPGEPIKVVPSTKSWQLFGR
jgi:hypothetical protein